mmetsp:Transcript_678/g.1434  ORF Transcript_678/g.1434 Transcript_678/m.1434 type:complete len:328 (+) Transcript_678:395-1378(+)
MQRRKGRVRDHGLSGPRAGARNHDYGQGDKHYVERVQDQYRRYSRARGLRRGGGADHVDDRRGAAARGRGGGPDGADQVRPHEGASSGAAADRGGEQGGQGELPHQRGGERRVRPLRVARGDGGPAGFSCSLRGRPERLGRQEPHRPAGEHGRAARHHPLPRPPPRPRAAAGIRAGGDDDRARHLPGPAPHGPHLQRQRQGGGQHPGAGAERGEGGLGPDHQDPLPQGPGRRRGAGFGDSGRHRAAGGPVQGHRDRHDLQPGAHGAAQDHPHRPPHSVHDLQPQRLAAPRPRGHQAHLPAHLGPPAQGDGEQRQHPGEAERGEGGGV